MLYAGLDLLRQRLDVHLLNEGGRTVEVTAVRPDADALRTLVARMDRHGQPVSAAIESMNGARFVHDTLELAGWDVEIADAQKVRGLAPPRGQDRQDRRLDPRRAGQMRSRARDQSCRIPRTGPSGSGRGSGSTSSATGRPSRTGSTPPSSRSATRSR